MLLGGVGRLMRAISSGTAFSPISLFSAGEPGVWYDPSDLSTLFQDAAGTIPITTPLEKPVGLVLDKSRGLVTQTGRYAGVFDGTGDYLSLANNAAFGFGSDAFTVEAWIYQTSVSATQCIISNYQNSTNGWALQVSNSNLIFNASGDGADITGAVTLAANTWYHVAVSGQSGSIKLFLNGSQQGLTYTGATALNSTAILTVGALWAGVAANPFSGYVSNVRVIKGTALYTANFTAPTAPLTAISGTSLLTCQNSTFTDNSSNAFTITANGDAKTGANNPFGNHATQSTSASRPVLSARYNLLTKTEQFDDAAWTKDSTTISANAVTAPDGTLTADKLVESATTSGHRVYTTAFSAIGGVSYTVSVCAKAAERNWLAVFFSSGGNAGAYFNLSTGVVGTVSVGYSASIAALSDGWFRCSITLTPSVSAAYYTFIGGASADNTSSYAGDITKGLYLWGADLRVTNDGVGLPAYQRVNTSTDYDTSGFPAYLRFDGTDDSLATGSIDFSATDKMSVFAGLRKLSDAAAGIVLELSATGTANGTFGLQAPNSSGTFRFEGRGTATSTLTPAGFSAPYTAVLTGQDDISAPNISLRVNSVQAAASTSTQGTGNFTNNPLYIGARGGSSIRYNGRLFALIVRGAASTDAQIASAETWVNGKTGAY